MQLCSGTTTLAFTGLPEKPAEDLPSGCRLAFICYPCADLQPSGRELLPATCHNLGIYPKPKSKCAKTGGACCLGINDLWTGTTGSAAADFDLAITRNN